MIHPLEIYAVGIPHEFIGAVTSRRAVEECLQSSMHLGAKEVRLKGYFWGEFYNNVVISIDDAYQTLLGKMNPLYEMLRFSFYLNRDGYEAGCAKMKELQLTYMEAARLARKKSKAHPMRRAYVQSALSAKYLLKTIVPTVTTFVSAEEFEELTTEMNVHPPLEIETYAGHCEASALCERS